MMASDFINETDLAEMLRVKKETVQQWRLRGHGPKYVKVSGKAVRYRLKDVEQFLKRRTRQCTRDE
jgi:predicted DNA-binding transcriptional regulator AlpA